MSVTAIAMLAVFAGILLFLFSQQKKAYSLSRIVLLGLVLGLSLIHI